jgi:hypothetical protein
VKVAFVVGFFSSVETTLRAEFKHEFEGGRLVCFNTPSPRYSFSFPKFKGHFFEIASRDDNDPVYVFAVDMRNAELLWVRPNLEGVIDSARSRENCRPIHLVFFENAQDSEAVADALRGCQLGGPVENHHVEESALKAYMNGQKALCIRSPQQTPFEEILRRANIQFEKFEDYFEEVELKYGSNVGKILKDCAKRYRCLIYVWGELKYMQPSIKDKWQAVHQGKTPASAVARFKEALRGPSKEASESSPLDCD